LKKTTRFLTCLFVFWLGSGSRVTAPLHAQEKTQTNWTSAEAPCAKYDDIRSPVLGNIGVKIDAIEPWADGFRRALRFWNAVLASNFHEEKNLDICTVRIIDGGSDILSKVIVARSQLTEWDHFLGMIAVSPGAAKAMSSAEIYGTAVHEFGHMLGLKHNASSQSIMYFLDVDGTEVLDREDISHLSKLHQLRPSIVSTGFVPVNGEMESGDSSLERIPPAFSPF